MTTYYVKPTGDNTKDGLSSTNAWETITYALTQMIANDVLNIIAGAYAESVTVSTEHITLTGAGSGSVTINYIGMMASYPTISGLTATAATSISSNPGVTNISLDDVVARAQTVLACADAAVVNNCDFTYFLLSFQANAPAFTNCTFRAAGANTLKISGSSILNATFENTTIVGDPSPDPSILISNCTNTTFTNTAFEHPEKAIEITSGATATFIQNNRKTFIGTVGTNTVTATESTLVVADGTYDYRDFVITPDASITIPETSLWETSGDQNKRWKVEATGSRTITFRLTDMLPDTLYDISVGIDQQPSVTSDSSGVLSFSYTGTFSEKVFSVERHNISKRHLVAFTLLVGAVLTIDGVEI